MDMQRSYTLPRHLYFNPMTHIVVAVVAVVAIVISYFSVITMDGLTNKNSSQSHHEGTSSAHYPEVLES